MEIIISSNSSKPIYEQITSQIKAMVMEGKLQPDQAIPSMRALAKSLHISVIPYSVPMRTCSGTDLLRLP